MKSYSEKLIEVINQCGEAHCKLTDLCKECTMTETVDVNRDPIRIYHLPVEGTDTESCNKICQTLTVRQVQDFCKELPYNSCDQVEAVFYSPTQKEFVIRIREIA